VLSENNNLRIEKKTVVIILLTLLVSTVTEIAIHYLFLESSGFMLKYAIWFLYFNISISFLTGTIWHFLAYRASITCMTGMMLGMSFGMQTGMMLGAIVGATNGFFVGSVVGTVLGVGVGLWIGLRSKTTMGVLQGLMSGIMGGTMGPMISVMMFSDHLTIFMPLYMMINVAILIITSYMFYEEIKDDKDVNVVPVEIGIILPIILIITIVFIGIILFLPKSAFLIY